MAHLSVEEMMKNTTKVVKQREGIYDAFKKACAYKNTTITHVLNEVGRSNGNTGIWKRGAFPRIDVAMDIAEYLGITLDELCYGLRYDAIMPVNKNEREWLDVLCNFPEDKQDMLKEWLNIIGKIPEDRQKMCKDFLKTHLIEPEKYENGKEKVS